MGKSLEIVLIISRYSVEYSPEIDLPRMGASAMAFAGVAIALNRGLPDLRCFTFR